MKRRPFAVTLWVMSVLVMAPRAYATSRPAPEMERLLDTKLQQAVLKLPLAYRNCIWPADEELQGAVPLGSIRREVLRNAVDFVGTVLKAGWVRESLGDHFIALTRKRATSPPSDRDWLMARYGIDETELQVMEDGVSVAVLVVPRGKFPADTSPKEYVCALAKRFLKIPEDRTGAVVVTLRRLAVDKQDSLHYGRIRLGDENMGTDGLWWHRVNVWCHGSTVYFRVRRSRGQVDRARATPGIPRRFTELSRKELARIAELSERQLVEMVGTSDVRYVLAALSRLKATGAWKRHLDSLLSVAAEKRGDVIVEALVFPVEASGKAEDKRLVDKYLDFLAGQLGKTKPAVSLPQAIRCIARTGCREENASPMPAPRKAHADSRPPPYGSARIVRILISCLDTTDCLVRRTAIRWLGVVGANDPAKAHIVVDALHKQQAKEEAGQEKPEVRKQMQQATQEALRTLQRRMRGPEARAAPLGPGQVPR